MAADAGLGTIVAAILLPPLGVFLARGLGLPFAVGIVLTLLGWAPGMIFALFCVMRPAEPAGA